LRVFLKKIQKVFDRERAPDYIHLSPLETGTVRPTAKEILREAKKTVDRDGSGVHNPATRLEKTDF